MTMKELLTATKKMMMTKEMLTVMKNMMMKEMLTVMKNMKMNIEMRTMKILTMYILKLRSLFTCQADNIHFYFVERIQAVLTQTLRMMRIVS